MVSTRADLQVAKTARIFGNFTNSDIHGCFSLWIIVLYIHQEKKNMSKKRRTDRSQIGHISRDKNVISGTISGSVIAQGTNAHANVQQTTLSDSKELSSLFEKLYQVIQSRQDDPNVDKEELSDTVQKIKEETAKGDQANPSKISRWMENLNKMAPDIVDVVLASLGGPVSGVAAALKKIAEHAQEARQSK